MSGETRRLAARLPRTKLSVSDRAMETLWGVLIVLSVTGSAQVLTGASGRAVFTIGLVVGFAWAVVEVVMDLLRRKMERLRTVRILARAAAGHEDAGQELADALRETPVSALRSEDREAIQKAVLKAAARAPPPSGRLSRRDLVSSLDAGLVLWGSTLPLLVPFLVFETGRTALAVSQGVAVATLLSVGAAWGRYSGQSPIRTGASMAAIGAMLAALLQLLEA